MLVRALEIEIGRPSELRPLLEHKGVGQARIEPHLDDIRNLLPLARVVGVAEKFCRIGGEPDICPAFSTAAAIRSTTTGSRNGSPVCRCVNTAIGTPQARWRETHQSGRFSTIASIRFRPCSGTQRVCAIAAKAFCRRPFSSKPMNHCGVLRKISGAFDRQECG